MPRMPSAAASGTCAASNPSGAIISPYIAMLGIVCTTLSTGIATVRTAAMRAQAMPSGTPATSAAATEPPASDT